MFNPIRPNGPTGYNIIYLFFINIFKIFFISYLFIFISISFCFISVTFIFITFLIYFKKCTGIGIEELLLNIILLYAETQ